MSDRIQFILPIVPVPKGRPRFTKMGRAYTPEATRRFEATVSQLSAKFRPREPWLGPLDVTVVFFMPKPKSCPKGRSFPEVKPDTDNLLKAVLDSVSGFWRDDAQVVKITSGKYYPSDGKVGIFVRINKMTEKDSVWTWLK